MEKIDLMVKAPHFYTMAGQGLGYLADGAMAVDSGKIKAIGPSTQILKAYQSEQILERPCHLVLPGFIDAHMHMVDALMR
ncbi:MAG: hypothetical protein HUK40_01925 [Desulfobacter sp.]|nr:hypothetical protein [Desulfobacter sp.]WDP85425.1 MAG: hypothetical protein HUN05_10030 [Desulfobacter sp.]